MVDSTALEKITFVVQTSISQSLAEDFATVPQVRIFLNDLLHDIVIHARQSILSQKLDQITVRYPADWRQAVKERFAPEWFKRRWPVEWHKTTIDVRAVYPKMALPDEVHFPLARILSDGGAIIDGLEEYLSRFAGSTESAKVELA